MVLLESMFVGNSNNFMSIDLHFSSCHSERLRRQKILRAISRDPITSQTTEKIVRL